MVWQARRGVAWYGLVRQVVVRQGRVWFGLAGAVWFGAVRRGRVGYGSARQAWNTMKGEKDGLQMENSGAGSG